jgi:hypothetical protein
MFAASDSSLSPSEKPRSPGPASPASGNPLRANAAGSSERCDSLPYKMPLIAGLKACAPLPPPASPDGAATAAPAVTQAHCNGIGTP